MITILRTYRLTTLAVLAVGFLVFLSVAGFAASDPDHTTEDRVTGAIAALGALALATGLWGLHGVRLKPWLVNLLIVPALIFVGLFFWFFLLPTVVAFVLLYAGVVRQGLQRELAPNRDAVTAIA